tara:strand:+ start:3969 stop:4871 length:903 start_codon:yes stop_codon:yes gene_type:complete
LINSAQKYAQRNRNTIFSECGEILSINEFPGDQYVMCIRAPICASKAKPGNFLHVKCDDSLSMRRPLSIMRVEGDCLEILYKIVGNGLRSLSLKVPGDKISILGPIGKPFQLSQARPKPLLIGGGVGIPPMVYIADHIRKLRGDWAPLMILGSELPFPFQVIKSEIETAWLDKKINSTLSLIENWKIPCRLTSLSGFEGCYSGYVTELARKWLITLPEKELSKIEIFSCGPIPMLKAVAALAKEYNLPCQVSMEEFMACAVGGCAGCTIKIITDHGNFMKRVCVDGPIFEASEIVWQQYE